jgi:hypothetical protein
MKKLFINFTIMTALITSMSSLAVASQKPESKLLSGAYYTAGSSYNNSRREVLNRKGKICMKIVDGPAANVRGQEKIIISSVSVRRGKLYLDANNREIQAYTGKEARQHYEWVFTETEVAFSIDQGEPWEFRGNKPDDRTTPEQNKRMQECVNTKGKYVRKIKGRMLQGRF